MTDRVLLAFDTETNLISQKNLAPKIICASTANFQGTEISGDLFANGDPGFEEILKSIITDSTYQIVTLNGAYDFACACKTYPDLIPYIFQMYGDGRVWDVRLREKLINLSTTGKMDNVEIEDDEGNSTKKHISYSMASLVEKYFGASLKHVKEDENAWRLRYAELDGKPLSAYPKEAIKYAVEDAIWTLAICREQQKIVDSYNGPDNRKPSLETQEFQAAADFALYMITVRGFRVDYGEMRKLEKEIEAELVPEKISKLFDCLVGCEENGGKCKEEHSVLRPPIPPKPHKNGAKNEDGTPKMTGGKPETLNTKILKKLVEVVCVQNGIKVKKTPTGLVSTDSEVLSDVSHLHPVLKQFEHRQGLMKLKSTELPRMGTEADAVDGIGIAYTNYNSLVETGRTSSFESKGKGKGGRAAALYRSFNSQNVAPEARRCFCARDGFVICSCDYSALELVSTAQQMHRFYQQGIVGLPSRLFQQINSGIDVHAYFGAQLAKSFSPEFAALCQELNAYTQDEVFEVFLKLKSFPEDSEEKKLFKWYRKYAKPGSLGLVGGLGIGTFIKYSKASYKIVVTEQEAIKIKDTWFLVYPEMRQYFNYINRLGNNDEYCYVSPMGMVRRGASYCAACNGVAMQSPSAEGAKIAVFNAVRACYDKSRNSVLQGAFPLAFIHDEILMECIEEIAHEQAHELSKIMVEALQVVFPDMKIKAQPVLMRRWKKDIDPVYKNGRLIPVEDAA